MNQGDGGGGGGGYEQKQDSSDRSHTNAELWRELLQDSDSAFSSDVLVMRRGYFTWNVTLVMRRATLPGILR